MRWVAVACVCPMLGCVPEPQAELVLRFDHRIGGEEVELGTDYTTRYGQRVAFDHVRYWVSNVVLVQGEREHHVPDSYYLVEHTSENTRLAIRLGVPPGRYDGLAFHIGVDPQPNGSLDLMAGELKPGIGMDWGWDTGYKFFRTEGEFEEAGGSGHFAIHVGTDVLYKKLTAELSDELVLTAHEVLEVSAEAELDRLFAGVELAKESEILGGPADSLAGKIAGNYARMFSLRTTTETVRMEASSPNIEPGDGGGDIPGDATPPVLAGIPVLPDAVMCGPVPSRPSEAERACMTPFLLGPNTGVEDAGFFTFVTTSGATVHAASTGIVSAVVYADHSELTHSDLFHVTVRPNDDSAFFVEYRNLKDVRVSAGEVVEVHQALGGAGDYFDAQVGAVSFGVRRQQERVQRLCPTRYATAEVVSTFEAMLDDSNTSWPLLVHDELCEIPSIVCISEGACETPADFVAAHGDVDGGRRIYANGCASCHGTMGEGGVGPPVCVGSACSCATCADPSLLVAKIEADMPPEGDCLGNCAVDVAAFILHELRAP